MEEVSLSLRSKWPLSHMARISRGFMAAVTLLPRINLVSELTMSSPSRMSNGQFSMRFWNAFAQR